MKITNDSLKSINHYSRILLIISSCIYVLTIVVYLFIIIFQEVFIPLSFEQNIEPNFIFPVINFLGILFGFSFIIIFNLMMLIKRNVSSEIVFELVAIVLVSLFNIIFPILMNSLSTEIALLNTMEYYLWFNRLTVMLGFTKFFIPFSLLTFYIGVAFRITLKKIYCSRID